MIALLSWLAMILTLCCVYLLAVKKRSGWWFGVISCLVWIVYGIFTKQPALILTDTALLFVNLYGLIKWKET